VNEKKKKKKKNLCCSVICFTTSAELVQVVNSGLKKENLILQFEEENVFLSNFLARLTLLKEEKEEKLL
jgi:hypothetical protein